MAFKLHLISLLFLWVTLTLGGPPLQLRARTGGYQFPKVKKDRDPHFNIEPNFRLPNNSVDPISYDLNVIPILNDPPPGYQGFTAPGSVRILVKALGSVNKLFMHKDPQFITVSLIEVTSKSGQSIGVTGSGHDETGVFVIDLSENLVEGQEYEIFVEYVAKINDFRRGLFRAEYTDDDGEQKWLCTTHFESVSFRKMAVGFDEPHLKAIFNINIGRSLNRMSLSNTDIKELGVADSKLPPDYVWDKFNPTVKMSTYLVALAVSDFGVESAHDSIFGKPVGIYGQPNLIARGAGLFTANKSAELLKFYENTFRIDYPMPKLDAIAVPKIYFPGAMENYGLNVYGDGVLLYLPGETLEFDREGTVVTLAHELAHQWFGNLVTCKWWSDLYLNEGFATYVSYIGAALVAPEYDAVGSIFYDVVQDARAYDVTDASHPVHNEGTQEMVEGMTIFDTITYGKGASLIRMVEGFLSLETLLNGLANYLERMKFQSAEQDDLFEDLNQVAHAENKLPPDLHLKTIMDTYTLQKGLPLVRVTVASPERIYISQQDYRNVESANLTANTLWEIPVSIATQQDPNFANHTPKFWLHKATALDSYAHDTSQWIILNTEGYGYYRVLYDDPLTTLIQTQLKNDHSVISSLTKSQLIEDYFRFADSGFVPYETALGMTLFLGSSPQVEDHHAYWYPASDSLKRLFPLISSTPTSLQNFKNYLLPKIEAALNQTNWTPRSDDEHGVNVLIRTILLDWACALGSSHCISLANGLLPIWMALPEKNPVPLDLQEVLYCAAIANGPQEHFDFILNQYKLDPKALGQRSRLVKSLTCSQNENNLIWLLENLLNSAVIKKEDVPLVIQGVGLNSVGRRSTVQFLADKWAELVEYTASDPEKIQTIIISETVALLSLYQNEEEDAVNLGALRDDIRLNNDGHYDVIKGTLEGSIETIHKNLKWTEKNLAGISDWLGLNSF